MEYNQQQRFCASRRKLLISGDVELDPGPFAQSDSCNNSAFASKNTSVSANPSVSLLVSRLAALGLRLLDVGGGGDFFFGAVSHQIYGTPNYHSDVCSMGFEYLMVKPERFIESNTEHSWADCLNNMSRQGTWCNAVVIQVVADSLNLLRLRDHCDSEFLRQTRKCMAKVES